MENWKKEISRLEDIRIKLGLSYYKVASITKESHSKVSRVFRLLNEPGLGFYLKLKNCLENAIEVDTESSIIVLPENGSIEKIKQKKQKPKQDKEIAYCGCKMSGALFIRERGCKKSKEEHNF